MESTIQTMPNIWVDTAIDKANIAFQHKNSTFYGGTSHAQILYLYKAPVTWPMDSGEDEESRGTQYLQHVSGLQDGVETAFILKDPCVNDIVILWSQYHYGNPLDRDVFCNYQATMGQITPTPTPPASTPTPRMDWMMVGMLVDTASGDSEYAPFASSYMSGNDYFVHIVSQDQIDNNHLVHSIFEGDGNCDGSWSTTNISNTSGSYYPSVAIRPSNNDLYIAYFKDNGNNTSDYYLLIFNGSTYTSYAIDDGPNPNDYKVRPVVGFDTSSNLYVAYIDDDLNVMVRKRTSGGSWDSPTRVDNQDSKDHSWVYLAMDPTSNKPHVVYDEENSDTDWDIKWSRLE